MHTFQKSLDRLAISASVICTLHCALIPVGVTLLPALLGGLLHDSDFHSLMLWLVLPTSALGIGIGCKKHKSLTVMLVAAVGLAILVFSATYGHDMLGHTWDRIITPVGGIVLSVAHVLNYRLCRHQHCKH